MQERARGRQLMMAAALIGLLLFSGCASSTETTMKKWQGQKITDYIEKNSTYPDSTSVLPNGNTVYRFTYGTGSRVNYWGNLESNVCRVWLEADPSGVIVRWRYENCS